MKKTSFLFFILIILYIYLNKNYYIDSFINQSKDFYLITMFKNYTPTFFTFRNFYIDLWDIKKIYYFVGYTNDKNYKFIKNEYIIKTGKIIKSKNIPNVFIENIFEKFELIRVIDDSSIESYYYLYKTTKKCSYDDWNRIKDKMFLFFNDNYYLKDKKYIIPDDDEFLYSKNIKNIKKKNEYLFHYIEIIPNDLKNFNFCLQCWYLENYRKKIYKYNCNDCKIVYFNKITRVSRCYGWKHNSKLELMKNSSCEYLQKNINKKDFNYNKLRDLGVCYHITGLTFKNLCKTKLENRHNIGDNYSLSLSTKKQEYENSIKKIKNNWKTVEDNTIIKYLDDKDIKLLVE